MCTVLALRLESRYSHLKSITKPLEMDVIVTLTFHFISFRSCAWHHHLSRVDCTPLYANSRARQKNQQNPSQMHMYIHIENHFKLHKWFVQRRKKSAKHQRQNLQEDTFIIVLYCNTFDLIFFDRRSIGHVTSIQNNSIIFNLLPTKMHDINPAIQLFFQKLKLFAFCQYTIL